MTIEASPGSGRLAVLGFWLRLHELEDRHQESLRRYEVARRKLEGSRARPDGELLRSWEEYCEAIEVLDQATSALELFRGGSINVFAA